MKNSFENWATDPMSFTEDNYYFPDLNTLTPKGIQVSLDKESSALQQLFKAEYGRLLSENQNKPLLVRRLLYMVDRAVFIMYLDKGVNDIKERDYWYKEASKLIAQAKEFNDDYLIKSAVALKAVFGYQDRNKRNVKLEQIQNDLLPIYELDRKKGNRMVYALCADYLSLCYLNSIWGDFKKLVNNAGVNPLTNGLQLNNISHLRTLSELLKEKNEGNNKILKDIADRLIKAVNALDSVISCQKDLIGSESNFPEQNADKWYLWDSYTFFNKARCLWLLYSIQKFTSEIIDYDKDNAEKWHEIFALSVNQRQEDYEKANSIEGFPQVLTFNFQAEYFRALFDYKTVTLIAEALVPNFKDRQKLKESISVDDWKKTSVYLGDTLDVIGLQTIFENTSVEVQTQNAIKTIKDLKLKAKQQKAIIELLQTAKEAQITNNEAKKAETIEILKLAFDAGNFNCNIISTLTRVAPYLAHFIKILFNL